MKTRLISLLLAFSMALTFLPVGAVSAFAAETGSHELALTLRSESQRLPPMICCPAKMHRGIL